MDNTEFALELQALLEKRLPHNPAENRQIWDVVMAMIAYAGRSSELRGCNIDWWDNKGVSVEGSGASFIRNTVIGADGRVIDPGDARLAKLKKQIATWARRADEYCGRALAAEVERDDALRRIADLEAQVERMRKGP